MIKVVKFGGSSLANAEQFRKVKDIIKSDADRRFVVPSAPGKRFSADTKVTDMLFACYNLAESDAGHLLEEYSVTYEVLAPNSNLSVIRF